MKLSYLPLYRISRRPEFPLYSTTWWCSERKVVLLVFGGGFGCGDALGGVEMPVRVGSLFGPRCGFVDDVDLPKTELAGLVGQAVLSPLTLQIIGNLNRRRLSDVRDRRSKDSQNR